MLTSNVRKEEPNRNDMSKQMPTNTMPSTNASAEPSNRSSSTFLSGFLRYKGHNFNYKLLPGKRFLVAMVFSRVDTT